MLSLFAVLTYLLRCHVGHVFAVGLSTTTADCSDFRTERVRYLLYLKWSVKVLKIIDCYREMFLNYYKEMNIFASWPGYSIPKPVNFFHILSKTVFMSYQLTLVMVRVTCLYLYWITLPATWAVLPRGPVRATPHRSSVTTGGNRITRRKPATLGRVKLENTLLTCDKGNFNQIAALSRNRTLVTVVRDTCTTTVPPTPVEIGVVDSELEKVREFLQRSKNAKAVFSYFLWRCFGQCVLHIWPQRPLACKNELMHY